MIDQRKDQHLDELQTTAATTLEGQELDKGTVDEITTENTPNILLTQLFCPAALTEIAEKEENIVFSVLGTFGKITSF